MKSEKEIGAIIQQLRGNMSLRDFAKKCDISHTTIDNLEKGVDFRTGKPTQAKAATLQKIAIACGVSISIFMDDILIPQKRKGIRIPVFGSVAAGIPIEAITDIEDYEEISEETAAKGDYFALRIKGTSMEPDIKEGSIVIVRQQSYIDDGRVAIVLINGDEATCKRVQKTPDGILLMSNNPSFQPMFFTNQQIEDLPIRIIGQVEECRTKIF